VRDRQKKTSIEDHEDGKDDEEDQPVFFIAFSIFKPSGHVFSHAKRRI